MKNNSVIFIDPDQETEVIAKLLIEINAFASIKTAELATTLDKNTQYRMRKLGRFPSLVSLNHHERRKAYRLQDLKNWLENPSVYSADYRNVLHQENDK